MSELLWGDSTATSKSMETCRFTNRVILPMCCRSSKLRKFKRSVLFSTKLLK